MGSKLQKHTQDNQFAGLDYFLVSEESNQLVKQAIVDPTAIQTYYMKKFNSIKETYSQGQSLAFHS